MSLSFGYIEFQVSLGEDAQQAVTNLGMEQ